MTWAPARSEGAADLDPSSLGFAGRTAGSTARRRGVGNAGTLDENKAKVKPILGLSARSEPEPQLSGEILCVPMRLKLSVWLVFAAARRC